MIFSHHNGKDQIMLQVRHQGDQQNLIQFQSRLPSAVP